MEQVTGDYQDADKIFLKSEDDEKYTFEKFTSSDQMVKEPAKLYFTEYSFQDSNFTIICKRLNPKESYKEKRAVLLTDTLVYNINKIESIKSEQFRTGQTIALVGGILLVGLIVGVVIAMQDFHPVKFKKKLF